MTLPTSGTMTWEMIINEFGGGHPINISNYYRNGPYVPDLVSNASIPTSGQISANQFYGASSNEG